MKECDVCSGRVDPEQPRSREQVLQSLVVGDLFDASPAICIVTGVSQSTIDARRLLVLEHFSFDRVTGIESESGRVIHSVAPLPLDVQNVLIALDRRHRLGRSPADAKLTETEKAALLFIADFYNTNAL
jgi:hypothetical protein